VGIKKQRRFYMSKELVTKYLDEGPHGLAYEELLVLVLGDENEEEVRELLSSFSWHTIKELIRSDEMQVPGVRKSTLVRLRAMLAVSVAIFDLD